MTRSLLANVFLIGIILSGLTAAVYPQASMPQYAAAEAGWQWPANKDGITYVPVCWENPKGFAAEQGWVKNKVLSTWAAVANVNFYFWGQCTATTRGIHILIADTRS